MNTKTLKIGKWRFVLIVRRNKTGRNSILGQILDWFNAPADNSRIDPVIATAWMAFWFSLTSCVLS